MKEFNETINLKQTIGIDNLKRDYITALKDTKFKKLVNRLKIDDEIGMKYTSKLEHTVKELNNCEQCRGLVECKNCVNGCVYYPEKNENKIDFNYVACKYKNQLLKEKCL